MTSRGPVVVGVDGSPSALGAVRLAAREAGYRNVPLRVVHAFIWPLMRVPLGPSPLGPPEAGLRHDAGQIVEEAIREATAEHTEVPVDGAVITGAAVPILIDESRHASMVVLGDRGLGGFTGLLLGSVAVQVAAHAHCSVLVARGTHRAGPVVVGVDGSPCSDLAVDFAMAEAGFRGTELLAVHAGNEQPRVLAEAIAGRRASYPDLKVDLQVLAGHAGRALVAASTRAQLVVVGARGRGGLAGLLLGSVSQGVLHHADCPVAIVRPQRSGG